MVPKQLDNIIQRKMMLPSNSLIIWRDEGKAKGSGENRKPGTPGINFWLEFQFCGTKQSVNIRRPVNEKLLSSIGKLRPKILKNLADSKQFNQEELKQAEERIKIEFDQNIPVCMTSDELLNNSTNNNICNILINSENYRIIREKPCISLTSIILKPLVGSIIFPKIEYRFPSDVRPTLHWFVKNTPENEEKVKEITRTKIIKSVDPNTIALKFVDEKLRKFSIENFTYLETAPYFVPSASQINHLLAVVADLGPDAPAHATISVRPVLPAPDKVITERQVDYCRTVTVTDSKIVRMMTYNMLADIYLNLNLQQIDLFFPYCDKIYQESIYRLPLILNQLKNFAENSMTLMFLQELDDRKQKSYHRPLFETLNFQLEFAKKMNRIGEGVAIAFSLARFELISSEIFWLSELAQNEDHLKNIREILDSSAETKERMLTRPTVVQIVVLKEKLTNSIFLCANTHLHHNPNEEYIKLMQAYISILQVFKTKNELEKKFKAIKVIFGGDFNSMPCGPVYQLFSKGKVEKEHCAWKLSEDIVPQDLEISETFTSLAGTPRYTNFTNGADVKNGFEGCLDYIWAIGVETSRVCPMPDHELVIEHGALPSKTSPSDHLPVIVDVKI